MDNAAMEDYLHDLRARQAKLRPAGTPSEVVYPLGEIGIPEYVAGWAAQAPDRAAIVFEGEEITYADLDARVRSVAGWLQGAGVQPGDRVALHLGNSPEFVVTFLAVLSVGAVHVPVNPMFLAAEMEHELTDSGAQVVVSHASLSPVLDAVRGAAGIRQVLLVGGPVPDGAASVTAWDEALAHAPAEPRPSDLDALAALNYTGGTTGFPKGCEHTQRHMLYTAAAGGGAAGARADGSFVSLCYLPVFWIAGENLGILFPLVLGGTSILLPRWDAGRVLELVPQHRVSTMVGTVENYLELLEHPALDGTDLSTLEDPLAVSFIRKLSPEVRRAWQAAAGEQSVLREAAYGMTETHTSDTSPFGLADGDYDLLSDPVFVGLPVPGTDIAVVSFESGEPVPLGEVGEIVVRGPSVLTGYWRNPEATAEQLRDGWLHTGDNGRIDEDGCLRYLGRDKEMIKVKGMSVFPAEVEGLLTRHAAVRTAAVVPAEHPDKGQVPVAFVSLEPGESVAAEELEAWARTVMAAYKVPRVALVTEFPMTTTGKIRKVELVETAQQIVDGRDRQHGGALD
jgi:long-chain acyl-CoA synthetase